MQDPAETRRNGCEETMPKSTPELLKGTLDLLILKTLAAAPLHGYAIARLIEQKTDHALQIEEGSLYPALYRMTARGSHPLYRGCSASSQRSRREPWVGQRIVGCG